MATTAKKDTGVKSVNNKTNTKEPGKSKTWIPIVAILGGVAVIILAIVGLKGLTTAGEAAQASRNDDERIADLVTYSIFVNQYKANNRGPAPERSISAWESMMSKYGYGTILDGHSGKPYKIAEVCKYGEDCTEPSSLTWEKNEREVYIAYGATCGDGSEVKSHVSTRRIAFYAVKESGGFFCVDG